MLAQTGMTLEQLPWRTRLKQADAMEQITVPMVLAAFDRLLAQTAQGDAS